jgi:hypothetical protein
MNYLGRNDLLSRGLEPGIVDQLLARSQLTGHGGLPVIEEERLEELLEEIQEEE